MRILATGFEPFGGQEVNPSWQAVSALPDEIEGVHIVKAELPVEWFTSIDRLRALMAKLEPDHILLSGQAGGRDGISIERVAINLCECAAPDNAARVLRGAPIVPGGPAAYFASYDHSAILAMLAADGIPAAYSFSAGAYLCNHVMYGALHMARPGMRVGFIHLPYLPGQLEGAPCMPLDRQVRALELCLRAMAGGEG